MSGGHFDYKQHDIQDIIDEIEFILYKGGKRGLNYESGEDEIIEFENSETLKRFQDAHKCLMRAYIYTKRIDWLLSGDDSEDAFHSRLTEELSAVDQKGEK